MLSALLLSVGDTALASFMRQSAIAYPIVSSAHIIGLGFLIGAIALLDLRILGMVQRAHIVDLARLCSRFAAIGLCLAFVSGVMLFSVQPTTYLNNSAFLLKIALIGIGLMNVAIVHRLPQWSTLLETGAISPVLRVTAFTSIMIWLATIVAGRWIAFV
ncbi:DUF6644 family protein [Aliidiomarina sanyensis]|uniref:DUF2214 domain-containing protein n=1 Tax=Aliidiomarina sanyensis TaxID=1249555 RepID=A0A432WEP0_9GAMM|nr:DUF6644 family protein [Aliidiomarina sanyensis]RUO31363.1 DUF2214 domain-containing protein [Aliidiomarina sanyensis]